MPSLISIFSSFRPIMRCPLLSFFIFESPFVICSSAFGFSMFESPGSTGTELIYGSPSMRGTISVGFIFVNSGTVFAKICVYYISLSSFRLSEVVCEDVSCYALGEKGIYYVSEDDGNVYYKTYQNSESIEKTAIENCSNSLLKYGDNGWLIQEQKSVSDGQIYAFNEVKGVSKILFKSNR